MEKKKEMGMWKFVIEALIGLALFGVGLCIPMAQIAGMLLRGAGIGILIFVEFRILAEDWRET